MFSKTNFSIVLITFGDKFCEYRKFEDWFKIILPDKLDDAFEGMLDDTDAFLDGWFAVRKIKGRHKAKDKTLKEPAENN